MSPTHGTPRQLISPHTSPQRLPHLPTCHPALSISFTDREASARSRDNCPQSTDEQTEGGSHTADEGRCHFGVPCFQGPGSILHIHLTGRMVHSEETFSKRCPALCPCASPWVGYTRSLLFLSSFQTTCPHTNPLTPPVHTLPRHLTQYLHLSLRIKVQQRGKEE